MSELKNGEKVLDDLSEIKKYQVREKNHKARNQRMLSSAHDLGVSLASIKIYLQLMEQGLVLTDDKDVLKHMLKKVNSMNRMVQDMFDLSNLEKGQTQLNLQQMSVGLWLQEIYQGLCKDLASVGMELRLGSKASELLKNPRTWGHINIDVDRINQVLGNYIDNAVKYSSGINHSVELEAYLNHGEQNMAHELVVQVIDHGVGMNGVEKDYVFREFYSKNKNGKGGNGLGLSIAKEIIEKHHGKIGVESQKGNGSIFFFTLPVQMHQ